MHLYYISDEQRMVMELARSIAREKIAPVAAHHDETETYPEEPMRLLAQQGLMGIWLPEAYGGSDMGALAVALVAEEIAWACAATATNWGATPLGGYPDPAGGHRGAEAPVPARGSPRASCSPPTRFRSPTRAPTRRPSGPRPCGAGTGTFSTAPSSGAPTARTRASSRCSPPWIRPGAARGSRRSSSSPGFRASPSARRSARWGSAHPRRSRSICRIARSPRRTASARKARASGSPCEPSTTRDR